jgi:hypothetical protein
MGMSNPAVKTGFQQVEMKGGRQLRRPYCCLHHAISTATKAVFTRFESEGFPNG